MKEERFGNMSFSFFCFFYQKVTQNVDLPPRGLQFCLEKGVSIQQLTRKAVPFTSAKRIVKKKLNDLSSRQYAERNSNEIWWNNFKDLPMWSRRKAIAEFCQTTGYDCLL
ncbi:hypothetical protein TNCV_3013861 [Trichonephila clavipes]|nr:hypothetical protein TNCV_3013861 [Trichonephila clavipes]